MRGLVIASGLWLLFLTSGQAILDLDNNGSSDIWEEQYSATLPANEDPDNDGATNKQEYDRGTNPLIPNYSYETIDIANDAQGGLLSQVRFFGGIARTFTVEETTDLVGVPWSEAGTVPGADATILMEEGIISDKKFFRVDPQGADPDGEPAGQGDKLDGVEEHILGTSNTSADSDGDGLGDRFEAAHRNEGFDPADDENPDDPNADPDNDGLTNAAEEEAGTRAAGEGAEDTDGDGVLDGDDGWALDAGLAPARLPEVSYAVIDLNLPGYEVLDMNNNGDILLASRTDSSSTGVWSGGQFTALPEGYDWNDINDLRTVVGKKLETPIPPEPEFYVLHYDGLYTIELGGAPVKVCDYYFPLAEEIDWEHHHQSAFAYWHNPRIDNSGVIYATAEAWAGEGSHDINSGGPVKIAGGGFTELDGFIDYVYPDVEYTGANITKANSNGTLLVYGYDYSGSLGSIAVIEGSTKILLSEITFDTNEGIDISDGASPYVVGMSQNTLVIWSKMNGIWQCVYDPQDTSSSRIRGYYHYGHEGYAINSRVEIIGDLRDADGNRGPLVRNGRIVKREEIAENYVLDSYLGKDITEDGSFVYSGRLVGEVGSSTRPLLLLPMELIPNFDRNETIDLAGSKDRGKITSENPFRWWINDDNDYSNSESKGDDTPGIQVPFNAFEPHPDCREPDNQIPSVDGSRDLIDFFPVYFDIKELLEVLPADTHTYKLKQEDGALNFVYTNLSANQADDFLIDSLQEYGPDFDLLASEAPTVNITASGVNLSNDFLDKIKNEEGKGILLFEGAEQTDKPLVLEVYNSTDKVTEFAFPIEINSVEDMYRRVNLRNANPSVGLDGSGGFETDTDAPDNYPDELTSSKWFVFVHGYNVDSEAGRSWNAEVFKRMHQAGSQAKFIAVQWYGDPPANVPPAPDYHEAVLNAFKTSGLLKDRLDNFVTGNLIVAAHSLGNMVASDAIANKGLAAYRYYLINAAVPLEAYDSSVRHDGPGDDDEINGIYRIVRDDWKPYWTDTITQGRIFASNWHELFSSNPSDYRRNLTWSGIFESLALVAYNFYSTGEDVVENPNAQETVNTGLLQLLDGWWDSQIGSRGNGEHAWVGQEIAKGSSFASIAFYNAQGGWAFNETAGLAWVGVLDPGGGYIVSPPDQINETTVTDEELAQIGFFDPFEYDESSYDYAQLYGPIDDANAITGFTTVTQQESSDFLENNPEALQDLLASAVPSRSLPTGANSIIQAINYDMQLNMDGWPSGAISEDIEGDKFTGGRWRHSDFKDIAYRYTHLMYDQMIDYGELDQ